MGQLGDFRWHSHIDHRTYDHHDYGSDVFTNHRDADDRPMVYHGHLDQSVDPFVRPLAMHKHRVLSVEFDESERITHLGPATEITYTGTTTTTQ